MKNTIKQNMIGIFVATSATMAFMTSAPVHAAKIFPPAHTEAQFTESQERSNTPVQAPWYRSGTQNPTFDFQVGNQSFTTNEAFIGPYYRATN